LLAERKALQQRVAELEQLLDTKCNATGRGAEWLPIAAEESRGRVHQQEEILNAPVRDGLFSYGSSEADPSSMVVSSTPIAGPRLVARTIAREAQAAAAGSYTPERPLLDSALRVVPNASWWSNLQVELPGGLWCPRPPPYAAVKPQLPKLKPPDDKPKLTRELAKKHASADNMLIATFVNYDRLDFAFTLVKHLIALNQPHYLVGALDDEAGRGLQARGIPTFFMSSGLTTKDYGWGTSTFWQLGLHQANLMLDLVKTGVDCLIVDADAFLLRDPFPYFRKLPTADVLVSTDHLAATNGYADDGLESVSSFSSMFNIGYIFFRASALEFVQEWRDTCFNQTNDWNQLLFQTVLNRGMLAGSEEESPNGPQAGYAGSEEVSSRLQKVYRTTSGSHLMAGVLPVSLFASGHTFFVSRMAHLMHTTPYMVHATFQYGFAQGKRHRLREG
jgi:hypothetical protein